MLLLIKEETDYLREENENKAEIIRILQINTDTINTEIMEQITGTNQIRKKQQLRCTKSPITTIGTIGKPTTN